MPLADPRGDQYDPVKRHERYLRTRQLKGRSKSSQDQSSGSSSSSTQNTTYVVQPKPELTPEQRKAHREEVQAQVEALQKRLERLRVVLETLVEQAKARSGVKPTKQPSPTKVKTASPSDPKTSKTTKLTPQQRKEAAIAAKKAYEKEKRMNPSQKVTSLQADIKEIQLKIEKARDDLKASVKRAQEKAGVTQTTKPQSKTAVKAVDNTSGRRQSHGGS